MIAKCKHCQTPFWRYRRDFPPAGFCSLPCYDNHRRSPEPETPPEPAVIVQRMRQHNLLMHGLDSALLQWDCARCCELESEYSLSLSYHQERLSREMIEEGRPAV